MTGHLLNFSRDSCRFNFYPDSLRQRCCLKCGACRKRSEKILPIRAAIFINGALLGSQINTKIYDLTSDLPFIKILSAMVIVEYLP